MWWKSATRKKWCQSCYQDAYSCIFILCILYQLNFQMQKIPWTMFSYYQNEISNLDMQLNIDILTRLIWSTFLHLKMGKSLHESETSNDNDIVYGVLVEIWLELIIQNRAREKQGEPLWTESKIAILTTPILQTYICAWASVWFYAQKYCLQWILFHL